MRVRKSALPLRAALIYAFFSALWILFSDNVLSLFAPQLSGLYVWLQTIKGWVYVIVSASLVYLVLRGDMRALNETELELKRNNRALRALSEFNRALVHAVNEASLLDEICRICVEVGGYRLAWVGFAEPEEPKAVRPVAQRGFSPDYLEAANVTWDDSERGRGPTGTAIRTGQVQVAGSIIAQPDYAPWRAAALRYGFASSIALPLVGDERVWGALNIYAGQADAFDEAEIALLSELASDLIYGIQSLHAHSERRAAAENIRRLNAELEQRVAERTHELTLANKELESFSYSVSHDLRAPLRAINGFASIVTRRYRASLNEEAQHYMDNIVQASDRMSRLIDDLLKYSRLGRAGVRFEPVQLDRILAGIQADMKHHLEELHGTLVIPASLPAVKGDTTLLTQVFTNLVENALKYRRPGVDPRVEVTIQVENDQVIVGVCDNGVGIPAEYLEKIFNIFQRLHNEDEYPGTGIGLATVKKSVELAGGKVWAESVVGEGSVFFVKITIA